MVVVTLDTGAGPVELNQLGTRTAKLIVAALPHSECAPAGTHRLRGQ